MPSQDAKSFQMLPVAHWWNLREKFKQSIPGIVTDNYLAATLNMKPDSARANVRPFLKDLGLIDDEGKTQDLARTWRDDSQYADACRQMRDRLYPEELISAFPKPSEDRAGVERWFANHTGKGQTAVRRMASIYAVIAEADISKRPETKAKVEPRPKPKAGGRTRATKETVTPVSPAVSQPESAAPTPPPADGLPAPELNINVEIHISADATPDQIDKIFESMAKHIYRKK